MADALTAELKRIGDRYKAAYVSPWAMSQSGADVPRLLAAVEAVAALCRDTDGNWLPPQSELPVGEFQAAIAKALLGEAPGDHHPQEEAPDGA